MIAIAYLAKLILRISAKRPKQRNKKLFKRKRFKCTGFKKTPYRTQGNSESNISFVSSFT